MISHTDNYLSSDVFLIINMLAIKIKFTSFTSRLINVVITQIQLSSIVVFDYVI